MKDKWTWGQYATILSEKDFKIIFNKAIKKGWLKKSGRDTKFNQQ